MANNFCIGSNWTICPKPDGSLDMQYQDGKMVHFTADQIDVFKGNMNFLFDQMSINEPVRIYNLYFHIENECIYRRTLQCRPLARAGYMFIQTTASNRSSCSVSSPEQQKSRLSDWSRLNLNNFAEWCVQIFKLVALLKERDKVQSYLPFRHVNI